MLMASEHLMRTVASSSLISSVSAKGPGRKHDTLGAVSICLCVQIELGVHTYRCRHGRRSQFAWSPWAAGLARTL